MGKFANVCLPSRRWVGKIGQLISGMLSNATHSTRGAHEKLAPKNTGLIKKLPSFGWLGVRNRKHKSCAISCPPNILAFWQAKLFSLGISMYIIYHTCEIFTCESAIAVLRLLLELGLNSMKNALNIYASCIRLLPNCVRRLTITTPFLEFDSIYCLRFRKTFPLTNQICSMTCSARNISTEHFNGISPCLKNTTLIPCLRLQNTTTAITH